jgi:hypothetical protein
LYRFNVGKGGKWEYNVLFDYGNNKILLTNNYKFNCIHLYQYIFYSSKNNLNIIIYYFINCKKKIQINN